MSQQNDKYMKEAIRLSVENVEKGGGPFGAVIVKDGEIIARGANRVTSTTDPTAHAEVTESCEIFTSGEPCPMVLAAIYWARIDRIYFGNTKTDAKNIGFDDSFIYEEIEKPINQRAIKTTQLLRDEALQAFRKWDEFEGKVEY